MSIITEITKHIELPEGKDRQQVLERLVRKTVKAEDKVWNALSTDAQKWINAGVDLIKEEKDIPDPDAVAKKVEKAPPPAPRASLDEPEETEPAKDSKEAPAKRKTGGRKAKAKSDKPAEPKVKKPRVRKKGAAYRFVTALMLNPKCENVKEVMTHMEEEGRPAESTAEVLWYDLSLIRDVLTDLDMEIVKKDPPTVAPAAVAE